MFVVICLHSGHNDYWSKKQGLPKRQNTGQGFLSGGYPKKHELIDLLFISHVFSTSKEMEHNTSPLGTQPILSGTNTSPMGLPQSQPDGTQASAAPAADGQDGTGATAPPPPPPTDGSGAPAPPAPAAPPPDGSGAPAPAAPPPPAADGQDAGATPEPAAPGADSGDGTGAMGAALAVPEGSQQSYQVTANSFNAVLALLRGWGWG